MKKIVLLAALIIIIAVTGASAAEQTWQNELKELPAMAITGLGITPEQEKALDAIYSQTVTEARQLFSANLSDDEKSTKAVALSNKFLTSSIDILTKQQLDAALTLGSLWIQSHKEITIQKSDIVPFLKKHGLTDSQMTFIDKSLANHIANTDVIARNGSLTDEQKDTELWKLRKSTFNTIHDGLQPDQQKAMDFLLKNSLSNYTTVKNKLPADLKPKFDALVKAIFTFVESKITLK